MDAQNQNKRNQGLARTNIADAGGNILVGQASHAEAVNVSDTVTFEPATLYVGSGGNLQVLLVEDTVPVIFFGVPSGSFLPILVIKVYSSVTDCSAMLLLR